MDARPLTYDWNGRVDIPVSGAHLSDMEVAVKVRMLMRDQLNHESVCELARDRIMGLSKANDQAQKCIEALNICIKQDDERAASLEARVTELEALLTFGLDYLKGGNPLSVSGGYRNGHLREQFRAALKDIPDA